LFNFLGHIANLIISFPGLVQPDNLFLGTMLTSFFGIIFYALRKGI